MHQRLDCHHDHPSRGFLNSDTTSGSVAVVVADASAATTVVHCSARGLAYTRDLWHKFLVSDFFLVLK